MGEPIVGFPVNTEVGTMEFSMKVRGVSQGESESGKAWTRVDVIIPEMTPSFGAWFAPAEAAAFCEGDVLDVSGRLSTKVRPYVDKESGETRQAINLSVSVEVVRHVTRGGVVGLTEALATLGGESSADEEGF